MDFILPTPNSVSFSVQVFKMMQHDFLPEGVLVIVTDPFGGFLAQLEIAMILAFIFTFPLFIYQIIRYISPALFKHEKTAILKSVTLSSALFLLGNIFAYFYMIPLTFRFMYPFTTSLGVTPFFLLDIFISWAICSLIATGVIFLIPVFMVVLSYLGLVSPDFWKNKWQQAFLLLLIFSALITPDQTGFTMVLLFVPLAFLYIFGLILTRKFKVNDIHIEIDQSTE